MKKFLTLFVLVCPLLALAQQPRQITGQVLDRADGAPLVGATVFIAPEETQAKDYNPQGTIAYEQGRFAFKLPASVRKVVVSYLGYEARTLDISGKSDFTIYLSASDNKVDAVVVTGYQRIEKRKLTSSISSVKMSDIARDGVASVDEMLSGSIAGLVSTPTSGGPGAASKIKIRSTVTLNGNTDPLWVLDGMPLEGNDIPKDWSSKESVDNLYNMSIAGLNPWDIEDITVLKDAAATAIYGARAANGVIIINTARGKIINDTDLANALSSGRVGYAAIDVLAEEPPVHGSPLIEQPHCMVTPHIAWAPLQARRRCMQIVEDNIRAFQQGKPQNVVNP